MRMRKKPNLIPRMERTAAVLVSDPENCRGRWLEAVPGFARLYLELGCGKGRFTADTAETMPETLLVAVEKVPDAMVIGMERVTERGIANVRFIDRDVENLQTIFAPGEVQRIYLNFCDPWPKSRDAKHRLTWAGFLRLYAQALCPGGEVHFKTDNLPLFRWSKEEFLREGWTLSEVTEDLHAAGVQGIMTDYEAKFHAQGVKINRLVATRTLQTKTAEDGEPERPRNASLTDARGRAQFQAAAGEQKEDAEA